MTTNARCGGAGCVGSESSSCNTSPCPINCTVSQWSSWSCSVTCGTGTATRTRSITAAEQFGGSCPEQNQLTEMQSCMPACCPLNCNVGAWSAWSTCSVTCGGGLQTRSRTITPAACGGSCSESQTSQSQSCNSNCCPQDCVIDAWSAWSACSKTCGGGSQSRTRTITPASCGGTCGTTQVSDTQMCNSGCCPQDCQMNPWSQWSACSQTCGGGMRSRTRSVASDAVCNGAPCPTNFLEQQSCGGACCAANCELSDWSAWSGCSVTCGGGMRTRSRSVTKAEVCGGTCDVLTESQGCTANGGCCPSNCVWSPYTGWSSCSTTCDAGMQTRTRMIENAAQCGGSCTGSATDTKPCMLATCPPPKLDCVVASWMPWSACSATCGTFATKTRTRDVTSQPANGGSPCPSLMETTNCGFGCCQVACVVSQWAAWSACSVTCGSGSRSRRRTVTTDAACNGPACPPLSETDTCSGPVCSTDCVTGQWSAWSACSQTCGNGERSRSRVIFAQPVGGGAACPALDDTQPCSNVACSCVVSAWGAWSPCTKACGGGTTTRTRTVTVSASDCPLLADVDSCNAQQCPKDCVVSEWAEWSPCSVTCGGGRRSRQRTITQAAEGSGAACPTSLSESTECATQQCLAPGQPCRVYSACTDCTANKCHFCSASDNAAPSVCQDAGTACPANAPLTAARLQECPASTVAPIAPTSTDVGNTADSTAATTTMAVEVVVSVADSFGVPDGTTTPVARATLSNGVTVEVRTADEAGVPSVGADGFALRDGASLELAFARDRPVSITRLVLASWDAGSDSAQLVFTNAVVPPSSKKRQVPSSVVITEAEQSLEEATRDGYTTYTLIAGSGAEFSLKSFSLVERQPPTTAPTVPSDQLTVTPPSAESGPLSMLAIILIAVFGGLCLCIVIGAIIFAVARSRRRNKQNEMATARDDDQPNLLAMDTVAPAAQSKPAEATDEPYSSATLQLSRSTSNYGPVIALPDSSSSATSRQHMYGSMRNVKKPEVTYDSFPASEVGDDSE